MNIKRLLEYGGVAASVLLIAFGIGAIAMSVNARSTVQNQLSQEAIVGSADMNPTAIKAAATEAGLPATTSFPTCDVANQAIKTGSDARCFAEYMRIHALEASGGLTYAQMGRFLAKADPTNPAGTNDDTAAVMADGKPVANAARNTWVTETALTSALNISYMAQQLALFGLVVGIALLLSGIGFGILAVSVLGVGKATEKQPATRAETVSV